MYSAKEDERVNEYGVPRLVWVFLTRAVLVVTPPRRRHDEAPQMVAFDDGERHVDGDVRGEMVASVNAYE